MVEGCNTRQATCRQQSIYRTSDVPRLLLRRTRRRLLLSATNKKVLALSTCKRAGVVARVLGFFRAMKPLSMSSPAGCAGFYHRDSEKRGHELLLGAIVWLVLRLPRWML